MSNKKEVIAKIEFLNKFFEDDDRFNFYIRSYNGYHYLCNRQKELIGGNWNDLLYFLRGFETAQDLLKIIY